MSSDWTSLPDLVWYSVCEYLPNITDIIHLSCTNRSLYNIFEQDSFWRHLIRVRYGPILLKRYCDEIFSNKNNSDDLHSSDKHLAAFQKQYSQLPPAILRNGWNLIVTGAQNGNMAGFAAAKRAKFYLPKLRSQLKMAIDENTFRQLIHCQCTPLLSKIVYYYLSQSIIVSFAYATYVCFDVTQINNSEHPQMIEDKTSRFGYVAILESRWFAAIRGEFHSIMPGRYAIFCRMKLDLLRYEQPTPEDQFTGEFTCIPEYGIMSSIEWDQEWFDLHYVISNSKNTSNNQVKSDWFEEKMGIITVYELSKVYFGLRIWQMPYRKYTMMCDSIELKIIE